MTALRLASVCVLVMLTAHGLALEHRRVVAAGDDPDLAFVQLLQAERRRRPADVDLPGHDLRQRGRRPAGRRRLGLQVVLLHERGDDAVRRRAVGRIGDRLAVGVLQRLDRRVRRHVPEEVGRAGGLGADDADRRALRVRGKHAHDAAGATPMSTLPEITACCVSPPPCVHSISSTRPCFLKMPARWPTSEIDVSQLPRWPAAIFSVSCACAATAANAASSDAAMH